MFGVIQRYLKEENTSVPQTSNTVVSNGVETKMQQDSLRRKRTGNTGGEQRSKNLMARTADIAVAPNSQMGLSLRRNK